MQKRKKPGLDTPPKFCKGDLHKKGGKKACSGHAAPAEKRGDSTFQNKKIGQMKHECRGETKKKRKRKIRWGLRKVRKNKRLDVSKIFDIDSPKGERGAIC